MNALAMHSVDQALFVVNHRNQEWLRDAQASRMAARAGTGRRSQIAAAIASIRAAFTPAVSRETTVVPRLSDYPYRS